MTTYYPGLHRLKRILREGFHILSLDPSTQELLTKLLHQLIIDKSLHTQGSQPLNRPICKTCPIHHPTNSSTSCCTNLTYPITTFADCKSMILIYQLQCTKCNAFYIGETHRSLSYRMNVHRFTTQICQLPFTTNPISKLLVCKCHTQTAKFHP